MAFHNWDRTCFLFQQTLCSADIVLQKHLGTPSDENSLGKPSALFQPDSRTRCTFQNCPGSTPAALTHTYWYCKLSIGATHEHTGGYHWNRKAPPTYQPNPAGNHSDNAIARINNAIAEENAKMNKLYSEIGKKYVESHAVDYEEGFSDLIKAWIISLLQAKFHTGVTLFKLLSV